jgi:hypothetical protein
MRLAALMVLVACASTARAAEPPVVAIGGVAEPRGVPVTRAVPPGSSRSAAGGATGRLAVIGVVLLLGLVGAGLAVHRWKPHLRAREGAGPIVRVVGRAQITSRHAVHLVRVGERLLIVGTGSGGPPALLGELATGDGPHTAGGPS